MKWDEGNWGLRLSGVAGNGGRRLDSIQESG